MSGGLRQYQRGGGLPRPKMSPVGAPRTLVTMTRRLGLLGGTFDPPHVGHLAIARAARRAVGLDEVRFIVANDPWQKSGDRDVTPAPTRVELVRALIGDEEGLVVDDCEIVRGGPSYTVETLEHFRNTEPGADLFLIVGSDTAARLCTWHRAGDVAGLSTLVVVNRPTDDARAPDCVPAARCLFVEMEPVEVSSTEVRARVSLGDDVTELTGPAVAAEIAGRRLYGMAA